MNQSLLRLAASGAQGSKVLCSGRVAVLRDEVWDLFSFGHNLIDVFPQHFYTNTLAIILKAAPPHINESGVQEKVKTYFVLAYVHPDMKTGDHDLDTGAVPPIATWPIVLPDASIENGVYELRIVPLTSIAWVTSQIQKVWQLSVLFLRISSLLTCAVGGCD